MAKVKAKKDPRGGARPGAGRPKSKPKEYSDAFKDGLLKALEKKAKDTGLSIYDVIVDMLYDGKTQDTVRVSLFKAFSEIMVVKENKKIIDFTDRKVLQLPQVQERPAEFFDPGLKKTARGKKKETTH